MGDGTLTNTATSPPVPEAAAASTPGLTQRVGAGMAWGQVGRIGEIVLTTAIAIVVVRALAPSGFGTYSLLTNLAGAASIFIPVVGTEALGAVLPRLESPGQRVWLAALVGTLRLATIGLVALVVIPLWSSVSDLFGADFVSVQVLVVTFVYWAGQDLLNTVAGLYSADLDLRPVALWRAAGQLLTLAGLATIELVGVLTVGRTIICVALGYVVAASVLALRLRHVTPEKPQREALRFALRLTPNVWLIGVLTYLVATHLGVLILGAITEDTREIAFYAAAIAVAGRAQLVLVAGWISVMVPSLGAARAAGGLGSVRHAGMRFAELWLIVALPLNLLLVALAAPLVDLLFGAEYATTGELLAWFAALSAIAALAGGPIGVGMLWALDRQRLLVWVRLTVAVLNLGLAVLLVYELDALGAILAAGIAAIATSGVELLLAVRERAIDYPAGMALRIGAAAAVAAALAWACAEELPSGFALAGGLTAGLAAYLFGLRVLRPFGPEHLELLGRVSPRLASSPLRAFARQ